jgi:hypothetical protein
VDGPAFPIFPLKVVDASVTPLFRVTVRNPFCTYVNSLNQWAVIHANNQDANSVPIHSGLLTVIHHVQRNSDTKTILPRWL